MKTFYLCVYEIAAQTGKVHATNKQIKVYN